MPGILSNFELQTSNFLPRFRADGDQTGFHAIPALQTAASVTAVFSSVLYSQTSSQEVRFAAGNAIGW